MIITRGISEWIVSTMGRANYEADIDALRSDREIETPSPGQVPGLYISVRDGHKSSRMA